MTLLPFVNVVKGYYGKTNLSIGSFITFKRQVTKFFCSIPGRIDYSTFIVLDIDTIKISVVVATFGSDFIVPITFMLLMIDS
jgi:hypothetical protein